MKHFVRRPEEYRRNIDPLRAFQRDATVFLTKHSDRSPSEIRAFVERTLDAETGTHVKIPQARVLVRDKTGDRKVELMRFDRFLTDVQERNRILTPTMTVYEDPNVLRSMLGDYLADNLKRRKAAKHEMFVAQQAGDLIRRAIKNSEQNTLKIKNNSMSGAHSSPHTILYNKSSHSTLTSTCRTATSYGNANNEKFLCGNRHYYSPDVVINNITSIITLTDLAAVKASCDSWQLRLPTVEETMACITRSTEPYWRHPERMAQIERYVNRLTDIERAAFVFVGDFYHTAQVNPEFVRGFLGRLSAKAAMPMGGTTPDEAVKAERKSWVKQMDANLTAFVSMLCGNELKGRQIPDIDTGSHEYGILAQTAKDAIATLDVYADFIRAFWVTDNMPSSVYFLPSIVRQGAITSDTDSTIFTVQYWPKWYRGTIDFTDESVAIANTLVFFSAETIRHILALFSANLGANVKEIHRLSMKNEYYFPVFCLTSRAKHYFAYMSAQEGNVLKELATETKGVALRSSNAPPAINQAAGNLQKFIMDSVMRGEKISLRRVLRAVAKIEESISDEIKAGGFKLLNSKAIRTREAYTNPESSNWAHYDLWENVFAPKYGPAPPPPYVAISVNLTTDNRSRYREWVAQIPDRALAARMDAWMEKMGRKDIGVMLLPHASLVSHGLPEEIIPAANIRGLIIQTMAPFYLTLETINYFARNKNNTRLVSDERWLLAEQWDLPELDLLP